MKLLLDSVFAIVVLSHLSVDILNGQRSVLLTFMSGPLGMSNAELGLASTIYVMSAAIVQPFFGYLTDRYGSRWVISGGVLWMAVFFSLGLIVPGEASIWLLVVASAGSGAFHPAGGMQATLRGRTHYSGRETAAASYFFVFGQLGFFFGPMLAGPLLERFGQTSLLSISIPTALIGLFAFRRLRILKPGPETGPFTQAPAPHPAVNGTHTLRQRLGATLFQNGVRAGLWTIATFVLLAWFQSWAQQNMTTFIPKYLSDMGLSASLYGLLAALFMGGTAIGNILGSNMADKYGKRMIASLSLLLSAVPFFLIPYLSASPVLYLIVPVAGILIGGTQSIVVVTGQKLIPGGMALATGLVLALTFSSGALGTYLSGYLADLRGFGDVFKLNALLVIAASLLALTVLKGPAPAPVQGVSSQAN